MTYNYTDTYPVFSNVAHPHNWLEFTQDNTYIKEYDSVASFLIG